MSLFTLRISNVPQYVGEYGLVKDAAKGLGYKASIKVATPDEVRTLPGVKAYTAPAVAQPDPKPFRLVVPSVPASQGLFTEEQRREFWGSSEGIGGAQNHVPDSPEKTRGVHRNFARMADSPSSKLERYSNNGLRFADEHHQGLHTSYVYGPRAKVEAEAKAMIRRFPNAEIRNLDTYSRDGSEWYAQITYSTHH